MPPPEMQQLSLQSEAEVVQLKVRNLYFVLHAYEKECQIVAGILQKLTRNT
jgi:hypothetical protein